MNADEHDMTFDQLCTTAGGVSDMVVTQHEFLSQNKVLMHEQQYDVFIAQILKL